MADAPGTCSSLRFSVVIREEEQVFQRFARDSDTEDAEGINLTHLSPPVRSWVYIGGLGKVMSKESAPPMLTCLSIHQQLWINRWIMGIVLWRLIHLIILHMLFLP